MRIAFGLRSVATLGIVPLLLAGSVHTALAASTQVAPFRAPVGWTNFAARYSRPPLLSWHTADGSQLVAETFPTDSPQLAKQLADARPYGDGKRVAAEDEMLCGRSVERTVTRYANDTKLGTIQVQTIGGRIVRTTYTRPASVSEDDRIVSDLDTLCEAPSASGLEPPSGWESDAAQLLGLWTVPSLPAVPMPSSGDGSAAHPFTSQMQMHPIDDGPSIRLVSFAPSADPARLADVALVRFFPKVVPKIVSTQNVERCGNPALVILATAAPEAPEISALEIRIEVTQSLTTAFALIYAHPVSQPSSAAAVASLATLCAGA